MPFNNYFMKSKKDKFDPIRTNIIFEEVMKKVLYIPPASKKEKA